jgi:hypothetical protein
MYMEVEKRPGLAKPTVGRKRTGRVRRSGRTTQSPLSLVDRRSERHLGVCPDPLKESGLVA